MDMHVMQGEHGQVAMEREILTESASSPYVDFDKLYDKAIKGLICFLKIESML
jgi:hypothetical protein